MLSHEDYQSLKKSVKGWNARKLRKYGIAWPPIHGWRTTLIREYESKSFPRVIEPRKAKIMPQDNELGLALSEERNLTAMWYARISGQMQWKPGECESLNRAMDASTAKVNRLISGDVVDWFASLPAE